MQRLAQTAAWSLLLPALAGEPALLGVGTRAMGVAVQHCCARQLHASGPWHRSTSEEAAPPQKPELPRQALINRMLYRSRQRGFLELDLLIGMWAEKELPRMTTEQVGQFEEVLDQENPDMFKWLTGQEAAPEHLAGNVVFAALQRHVRAMTDQHHSVPRASSEMPKEWVRGWNDSGADLLAGQGGGGAASGATSTS